MNLSRIIADLSTSDDSSFVTPTSSMSWRRWAGLVERYRLMMDSPGGLPMGLVMDSSAESFALLAALGLVGANVYLIDGRLGVDESRRLGEDHGLISIVQAKPTIGDPDAPEIRVLELPGVAGRPVAGEGSVTIFTSGSTGLPRPVCHDWRSLIRPARPSTDRLEGPPRRWLWTFRPHLYAGLQVLIQGLVDRATLVIPPGGAPAREMARLIREASVTHVSSTPSYWRWLLAMTGPRDFEGVGLAQITLGGEVVDQDLLDRLGRAFPRARLVHIYATSELGRCFSVTDGLAGFPSHYLDRPTSDNVELRVEDGELFVRSANAAQGRETHWTATGDLVGPVADRFLFQGRLSEQINVGGNKVSPVAVERVLQSVSGVLDSRVFGRRSSLTGQLVACEIVLAPDHPPGDVRREVLRRCQEALAPYQRPRFVEFVDAIHLSAAAKKLRGPGPAEPGAPIPPPGVRA
jgi:acyl-CoA synthetase (AMP-forming)/AMP-acid ligase II